MIQVSRDSAPLSLAAGRGAIVVLDTNVVLEWLLFQDPHCAALAAAISAGHVRWLASEPMRGELAHVLGRGIRGPWTADAVAILRHWDRWAAIVQVIDQPALHSLRCSDADDQKFVDLALQVGADALLSNDRAVLKLRRRAASHGLRIMTARNWSADEPDGSPPSRG